MRWTLGVVIGKFRPPHRGHGLLIETAQAQTSHLVVFVCADASDPIPADLRAAWLRELHPSADVRVVETTGFDPDDSALWARLTRAWLGRAPDVVFTSEAYGDAYARYLGATHVCVDLARAQVPISASRILAQPQAYAEYLEPTVRAYFVPRVVLAGAESTGKTTLARALAAHYGTTWAPEYGRLYWDGLLTLPRMSPATADFVHIATVQRELEARLATHADPALICDTDAFCTWLWHERYMAKEDAAVAALARTPRWRELYLLTGDEIPWEDDGTRDREQERGWFHARFRAELERHGLPFVTITGSPEARLTAAIRATDELLAAHP